MNKNNKIDEIVSKINSEGYCVLDQYFDETFCKDTINEIDHLLNKNPLKYKTKRKENSSGDNRIFKFEKKSNNAASFKNNFFLNNILLKLSPVKSLFVLGGKVDFIKNHKTNSGGGWHRDSFFSQYKVMVYLSDVKSVNGPFLFLPKSKGFDFESFSRVKFNFFQRIKSILSRKQLVDLRISENNVRKFEEKFKSQPIEITAKQGTVIIFDGSYTHKAKEIEAESRYTLTNYYFKKNIISYFLKYLQFKNKFIK